MAQKESFFENLAIKTKTTIKSSLANFPYFVVLCLEHVEKLVKCIKVLFPFETKPDDVINLVTSHK